MQVGDTVRQSGAAVKQRHCRLLSHPRIAVCGSGHHRLGKPQYAAQPAHSVERRYEVHFGRPGIGEAHRDIRRDQRSCEAFSAVHVDKRS